MGNTGAGTAMRQELVIPGQPRMLQPQWRSPRLDSTERVMAAGLWCMLQRRGEISLPEELLEVCNEFLRREWMVAWWNWPDDPACLVRAWNRVARYPEVRFAGPMSLREAEQLVRDKIHHGGCRLFCRGGDMGPRPSTDGWHLAGQWSLHGGPSHGLATPGGAYLPYPKPPSPEVFVIGTHLPIGGGVVRYEAVTAGDIGQAAERAQQMMAAFRVFYSGGGRGPTWRVLMDWGDGYHQKLIPPPQAGLPEVPHDAARAWHEDVGTKDPCLFAPELQPDEELEDVLAAHGTTVGSCIAAGGLRGDGWVVISIEPPHGYKPQPDDARAPPVGLLVADRPYDYEPGVYRPVDILWVPLP